MVKKNRLFIAICALSMRLYLIVWGRLWSGAGARASARWRPATTATVRSPRGPAGVKRRDLTRRALRGVRGPNPRRPWERG